MINDKKKQGWLIGEEKFRLNFSRHTNREEASLTANKVIMFKLLNFKTTKIYKKNKTALLSHQTFHLTSKCSTQVQIHGIRIFPNYRGLPV